MKKHIIMNFVNPNPVDGERPYRVHCNFVLDTKAPVVNVYACPNIKKLQEENVDIRVIFHNKDEVFIAQTEESAKQLFDKVVFKNLCKNCRFKKFHRSER